MPTLKQREHEQRKQHAIKIFLEHPEMTLVEVKKITGLPATTLSRVKKNLIHSTGKTTETTEKAQGVTEPTAETHGSTPLDFQDSPEPVEKKSIVDQGIDSLWKLLGLKGDSERKSVILPAKLDSKRQAFVDSVTPTVSLAFTLTAAWAWTRIGP